MITSILDIIIIFIGIIILSLSSSCILLLLSLKFFSWQRFYFRLERIILSKISDIKKQYIAF